MGDPAGAQHGAGDAQALQLVDGEAGDPAGELRVLSRIPAGALPVPLQSRYFELLLARSPERLMTLVRTGPSHVRDAAAGYVVAHGTADQALAAIRARGQGLPPVWTNAYTALVGLHLARFDETTTAAFQAVLGAMTVGGQLKAIDRSTGLAGNVWFEYGSRFAEYLTSGRLPGAADYLPAETERTPARSDPYAELGDFYRDQGAGSAALTEYQHAATLNARRVDVHLRAAPILLRQGQRSRAIDEWREALRLLAGQIGGGADETAPRIAALDAIGSRALLAELKEPADRMVRAYVARNGAYRSEALLRAAFRSAGDTRAGTSWLIDLMRAAPNQLEALAAVAAAAWLPNAERDRVFERIVAVADEAVAGSFGAAQSAARDERDRFTVQRIRSLIETKQTMRAGALLSALPAAVRDAHAGDVAELEARTAAGERTLEMLLDRYRRDETRSPDLAALTRAASALRRGGDTLASRQIMEFVYTQQLDRDEITPPVLLGLAEIRLQQQDLPAALDLLRRLTLVVGEPFGQLPASAALLERLNHPAEALEFRTARVRAVPWDGSAQVALARTELVAAQERGAGERASALDRLRSVVESPDQHYAVRVDAARRLAAAGGRLDHTPRTELDWLRAPGDLTQAVASRPMFVAARVAAAARSADLGARAGLLRAAVAVAPGDMSLRVPLFRAQLAAARPADAIEALQPILRRSRSLTNTGLTGADRARLARELGEAHLQVDRLPDAVRFFTIALEGQTAPARAALRQQIANVNQEIARRASNAGRQPRIGEPLEQPQRVRPRIPPRAPAAQPVPPSLRFGAARGGGRAVDAQPLNGGAR